MNKNKINIGNSGEYFVAAELERRGFSVGVPMSNVPLFDLLAVKADDPSYQICIQVKTTNTNKLDFPVGAKAEKIIGKNIYYVFVVLNGLEIPTFYIVPSEEVCKAVKERHQKWLDIPGKNKQPHNNNGIRKYKIDNPTKYQGNWDMLEKVK